MLAWASFMGGTEHTNPHPPKRRAGNYALNCHQGKSSRQDRRRSDRYELKIENTNNPNTAKARIITITRLPPNTPLSCNPRSNYPCFVFNHLTHRAGTLCNHNTTHLPSHSYTLPSSPRTLFPLLASPAKSKNLSS